ncbi:MAG: hypothetical protein II336_16815 [Loktanella sp.]|nr:hypothetical protein [Loktanella sp.]
MMMIERTIMFRLFVSGYLPNSAQAITNLKNFCEAHPSEQYNVDVVDIFENPDAALEANVFMTPQLVVLSGSRKHVLIGDLSDTSRLAQLLSFET